MPHGIDHPESALTLALDARTIHGARRRGTGKNLIDLYRHVLELRPRWSVIGFHRGPVAEPPVHRRYGQRRIEMIGDRLDAWRQARLPWEAWRAGAALLHHPANFSSRWEPIPTLLTVHDLLPLDDPNLSRGFDRTIRQAVHKRTAIITPSQYTANCLIEQYGLRAEQITINPWAADSSMRRLSPDEAAHVLLKHNLCGPYLLHLGSGEPRKNTSRVIQSFAMLSAAERGDASLVIVGIEDETARRRLLAHATDLGIGNRTIITGFADEADIPALFSAALGLIYPSLGEGFGLPILDAWAAGIPVLTSSTTSLPEVAGEAAELVDPRNIEQLAHAMARLINDAPNRTRLIELGAARLCRYTWRATAERFIAAAGRALEGEGVQNEAA